MDGASARAAAGAELTRAEVVLTRVLTVLGVVFALLVGCYVALGIFANAEYPFVANSAAKDGLFAALCIVAANDIRRFGWAVYLVIGGHVLLIAGLLVMGATGNIASIAGSLDIPGADTPSPETQWAIWLALATAVTALVTVLLGRAQRERYALRYLTESGPPSGRCGTPLLPLRPRCAGGHEALRGAGRSRGRASYPRSAR